MPDKKSDEVIIAVDRGDFFGNEHMVFQGGTVDKQYIKKFTQHLSDHCISRNRGELEENPNFKQPIPYVLIKRGDEFFVYERLKAGGEARLFGKVSIGVGGHMNPMEEANNFQELLEENMKRELEEEVEIASKEFDIRILGFINDDTDKVGLVHIGILALIELPLGVEVSVVETHKLRGFWATRAELGGPEYYKRLENWSQIALEMME